MENLRIVSVQIIDSNNIVVNFTHKLSTNLVTSNVSITSDSDSVPNSEVLKISVKDSTLHINCLPLSPYAVYYLNFVSTPSSRFISLNGDAIMSEDNVSNKYMIIGPIAPNNVFYTYLQQYLNDSIYSVADDTTLVNKFVQSLSVNFSKALYDIGLVKNENYLSELISDERKIRGSGPYDRLDEEGAYQILRIGRTPSLATATATYTSTNFPSYPITLQGETYRDTLTVDSVDEAGKFNINTAVLNLSKNPVTKVTSIIFTQSSSVTTYTYSIETLGYQLQNSRYDQDYSSTYLQLENNQVKLNNSIFEDPDFSPTNIVRIDVVYEYKNLGRVINEASLSVYNAEDIIRETLPPIINVFNLKHAPIINSNNDIPTLGGVTFTDPNNVYPNAKHPAFVQEIKFSLSSIPSIVGQYSIDYETGTVYVYGSNSNHDGTGAYPPLATYKYRFTYESNIDYVYDVDLLDFVTLPNGTLRDYTGTINYEYEDVFALGTDYNAALHQEELSERAQNRLVALNTVKTKNLPITNAFRVYNETSGEIYNIIRWSDDKIYFRYQNPPTITSLIDERASFNIVSNEMLFVNTEFTNINGLRIFKVFLDNNNIISATEDSIASSFNTSLYFTNTSIFTQEKWFNRVLESTINTDNLTSIGQYTVDYYNGVIYCAVSNTQDFSIGFATYKDKNIIPVYPHVVSTDDLFYRLDALSAKGTQFEYISFEDGSIVPGTLDYADELYLNNFSGAPYLLHNSQIGAIVDSNFTPGVTNQIKFVRSVYEYSDLANSTSPINFVNSCTSSGYEITAGSIQKQMFDTVQYDGYYYVNINENIPYLSPNITYTFNVTRVSDSLPLWDISGTIVPGNPLKLVLSGINTPVAGELVNISYTITINDLSRVIIDYNKGEFYIDYTYLADELILSYEYGDNTLDFRSSTTVSEGDEYYVTYRAGALRDALYRNFGNLINIPELVNFDIDFDRERYRDALTAALSSFIQGPTVAAIKNIGHTISHIEPEIIESVFQGWSLGNSLLNPQAISTEGSFQLLPAKFDNGVLIDTASQEIKFPINSNIKLEEGTFETWIVPQWNGIDNDATLTFSILKDGYVIDESEVFIGTSETHPTIESGTFSISKLDIAAGSPNKNKDGVFIYYDLDGYGDFYRWFVEVVDGYVDATYPNYRVRVTSTGSFYDSKTLTIPKPSNVFVTTGSNNLSFNISAGTQIDEGVTFISDVPHYVLDFGESALKNRVSLFKDISGYLNFKVVDKDSSIYNLSSDVSSWRYGDSHHVAISWKLNTINSRDEMHLFVDGLEVPNIIRYGQKLQPYLHEKYRTIDPEEILGLSDRDIISGIDMVTTLDGYTVSSGINFSAYDIFPNDRIFIDEVGFDTAGYLITTVYGQTLTLSSAMPVSLTNVRFSVNRTAYTVTSEVDIASNITVSTIHSMLSGSDLSGLDGYSTITSSSINFSTADVLAGYLIRIEDPSLPTTYSIVQVSNYTLTINGTLPVNITDGYFHIYSDEENEIPGIRAVRPSYSISKDGYFNNILTISNEVESDDLILIRTLGLNNRRIRKQYYVWSDNLENILMTRLPPPISLDEAKIIKVIFPTTVIGPLNSTLTGGTFYSNNFVAADGLTQPSNSQAGRTISVNIAGNNVDFSTPVQVIVNGVSGIYTITETLSFNDYGTIDLSNMFVSLNYIQIIATPINPLKAALAVTLKEKYSITYGELSGLVPVVKYSYQIGSGYNLYSSGDNTVSDGYCYFSELDVDNYLLINAVKHTPALPSDGYLTTLVAGFYKILSVSEDKRTLTVLPTSAGPYPPSPLPVFTGGIYQILNVNAYRSGLQNGFFTFEADIMPSISYLLSHGFYELDYAAYARIKLDMPIDYVYLGSDIFATNQLNAIMDQVKIYSTMLTDTRIGETISSSEKSITKDYNSLIPLQKDSDTLMLINFNEYPFVNSADFYMNSYADKQKFHSSIKVNENFTDSLVILDDPLILNNDGILDCRKQGTIEFWTSPLYDTANDPNTRYYLNATSAVIEEAISENNVSVKISAPASQILSVTLKNGDQNIDYFAGGKLEIDTQRAIVQQKTSISNNKVVVDYPILQIISVKIVGDYTETDYFSEGSIGSDNISIYLGKLLPTVSMNVLVTYQTTENQNLTLNTQIIRLNRKLPAQNSHVLIKYLPSGTQGDSISLFKDEFGYLNFSILASGIDYLVRAPTRWVRDTWHKVKASYKINSGVGQDEISLFIDGYRYSFDTSAMFGSDGYYGSYPIMLGGTRVGDGYRTLGNIIFKDSINTIYVGSDYTEQYPIFGLINNMRISNIFRPYYAPYNEPIDVSYNSNLNVVYPVTSDLYTTYLQDSDVVVEKTEDFSTIVNRETGAFDFLVNIFDSLGIVNSSIKSKEALEKLIKVLKPANSKTFIKYER